MYLHYYCLISLLIEMRRNVGQQCSTG